jgi:hypothetical protein
MPSRSTRREFLKAAGPVGAVAALGPILLRADRAWAQDNIRYFRIGTGASSGTYYPVGTTLANAISNPPGSRPCDRGGACGVPGLVATAQTTQGSVQNIGELAAGRLDSALVQADIAHWALRGEEVFSGTPPFAELRLIATLFPEVVQLVVRKSSGIARVADLAGKRVSLGERGSGTLVNARMVIEAAGLRAQDVKAEFLNTGQAADALQNERLDAFFFVSGMPAPAIADLAEATEIAFVPIAGPAFDALRARNAFFSAATITAKDYKGAENVPSLAVSTLWVVSAKADAELIYGITKALWHPNTRTLLDKGHRAGRLILLETALDNTAIPLHAGAERYYNEIGRAPGSRASNGEPQNGRKN